MKELKLEDFKMISLFKRDTDCYYFDNDGILQCYDIVGDYNRDVKLGFGAQMYTIGDKPLVEYLLGSVPGSRPTNRTMWKLQVTKNLKVGSTFDEMVKLANDFIEHRIASNKPMEKTNLGWDILGIATPVFIRKKGNDEYNTFDYINCEVLLLQMKDREALKSLIRENKDNIGNRVFNHIRKHPDFIKYGVSINDIKLLDVRLTNECRLIYTLGKIIPESK